MDIEVIRGEIIIGQTLKLRVAQEYLQDFPLTAGKTLMGQVQDMLAEVGLGVDGIETVQAINLPDATREYTLTGKKLVRAEVRAA